MARSCSRKVSSILSMWKRVCAGVSFDVSRENVCMYPPDQILRTPLYRQLSCKTLGDSISSLDSAKSLFRRKLMQSNLARAVCLVAALAMAVPAFAQYGYPLKGTFSGDWWTEK